MARYWVSEIACAYNHLIEAAREEERELCVPLELLMISQLWRRSKSTWHTPLAVLHEWLNERLRGIIGVAFNLISQLLRLPQGSSSRSSSRRSPSCAVLCHKELSKLRDAGAPDDRRKDKWEREREGGLYRGADNASALVSESSCGGSFQGLGLGLGVENKWAFYKIIDDWLTQGLSCLAAIIFMPLEPTHTHSYTHLCLHTLH